MRGRIILGSHKEASNFDNLPYGLPEQQTLGSVYAGCPFGETTKAWIA